MSMPLWVVALFCLLFSNSIFAESMTPQEYRLDNGLKIIVKEMHRAPLVSFQIWYKVGSSYEPWGITGISHALEHMMFKGTHQHPGNEFSELMAGNGADQNAATSA